MHPVWIMSSTTNGQKKSWWLRLSNTEPQSFHRLWESAEIHAKHVCPFWIAFSWLIKGRKIRHNNTGAKGGVAPNEGLCIRDKEDLEFSFDIIKEVSFPSYWGWDNHFKVRRFRWLSLLAVARFTSASQPAARVSKRSQNDLVDKPWVDQSFGRCIA